MAMRPGAGSQSFSGALATDKYQGRGARRARGMTMTKSRPTYKQLVEMLQKDFYGPDFGDQPYQIGSESYFSPNGANGGRGGSSFSSRGPGGSFYDNEGNLSPYTPTGNNGVGDGELASGLDRWSNISRDAMSESLDAAFDQFLAANWPAFAAKAASIIANYSARNTAPYTTGGDNIDAGPVGINKAKKNPFANDDDEDDVKKALNDAVVELQKSVEANMEAFAEILKRDFL